MKLVLKKCVWLIVLFLLVVVVGCYNKKKDNIELFMLFVKDFKFIVKVFELWIVCIGDGVGDLGVCMCFVVVDGVFYVVSIDGDVVVFDVVNGKMFWLNKLCIYGWFGWGDKKCKDVFYVGGLVVLGDLLVIGMFDGYVYGMFFKDGLLCWIVDFKFEVIMVLVIVGDLVLVCIQDGCVYGLDKVIGDCCWVYDQGNVLLLSVCGNGLLLVVNGVVFFGFDDGKFVVLCQDIGDKLWEQCLVSGEGCIDIECLNDVDGVVVFDGIMFYSIVYYGSFEVIDGFSGCLLWNCEFFSFGFFDVGGNVVYVVNDELQVWVFDKSGGVDQWKNDVFKYCWLISLVVQGNYVVVGDVEGYVYWLQIGDGVLVVCECLLKKVICVQLLVIGDIVYVEDIKGYIGVYCFLMC